MKTGQHAQPRRAAPVQDRQHTPVQSVDAMLGKPRLELINQCRGGAIGQIGNVAMDVEGGGGGLRPNLTYMSIWTYVQILIHH